MLRGSNPALGESYPQPQISHLTLATFALPSSALCESLSYMLTVPILNDSRCQVLFRPESVLTRNLSSGMGYEIELVKAGVRKALQILACILTSTSSLYTQHAHQILSRHTSSSLPSSQKCKLFAQRFESQLSKQCRRLILWH